MTMREICKYTGICLVAVAPIPGTLRGFWALLWVSIRVFSGGR
jgi:hypothetical protein